jgi:hypothetical protein
MLAGGPSFAARKGWGFSLPIFKPNKCRFKVNNPTLAPQGWATPTSFNGKGCGIHQTPPTLLYSMSCLSGIIHFMRIRRSRITRKGGPPGPLNTAGEQQLGRFIRQNYPNSNLKSWEQNTKGGH